MCADGRNNITPSVRLHVIWRSEFEESFPCSTLSELEVCKTTNFQDALYLESRLNKQARPWESYWVETRILDLELA